MTTPIRTEPEQSEVEEEARVGDEAAAATSEPVKTVDVIETAGAAIADAAAAREATEAEAEKPRPFQSLIDLLHDLAIAVVVCVLLITYIVQAFKVQVGKKRIALVKPV